MKLLLIVFGLRYLIVGIDDGILRDGKDRIDIVRKSVYPFGDLLALVIGDSV